MPQDHAAKIAWLLGAGFSVDAGIPETRGLWTRFQKEYAGSPSILDTLAQYFSDKEIDIEGVLELLDWVLEGSPVLDVVRPLSDPLREQKDAYAHLRQELQRFIHKVGVPAPGTADYVEQLLRYLHLTFGTPASPLLIFTFNYDCTVEIAAAQLGLAVDTGFAGRWREFDETAAFPIRLHKLHGSVTWYHDQATLWEFPIQGEPDTTIWGQPLTPVMLYPGNKTTLHREPFLTLHQQWRAALSQGLQTLMVIGYSFRRDPYVRDVIEEWVKGHDPLDRHVVVVDPALPLWLPTVDSLRYWSWIPLRTKDFAAFLYQEGFGTFSTVAGRPGTLDRLREVSAQFPNGQLSGLSVEPSNNLKDKVPLLMSAIGWGLIGAAWYVLSEALRWLNVKAVRALLGVHPEKRTSGGPDVLYVYETAVLLASAIIYRPSPELVSAVVQALRDMLAIARPFQVTDKGWVRPTSEHLLGGFRNSRPPIWEPLTRAIRTRSQSHGDEASLADETLHFLNILSPWLRLCQDATQVVKSSSNQPVSLSNEGQKVFREVWAYAQAHRVSPSVPSYEGTPAYYALSDMLTNSLVSLENNLKQFIEKPVS